MEPLILAALWAEPSDIKMDIVQFLLSVINLILAIIVLFGGRFFLSKVQELQSQINELKRGAPQASKPEARPIQDFIQSTPSKGQARKFWPDQLQATDVKQGNEVHPTSRQSLTSQSAPPQSGWNV